MSFEDLVGAIRAADGDDADLAAATQLRVRRSLESRARSRHQLVGVMTAAGILLGGTVSWALATGHVAALWSPPPPAPAVHETLAPTPAPAPPPRRGQTRVTVPAPVPLPEPTPEPVIARMSEPAPAPAPSPETIPVEPPRRPRAVRAPAGPVEGLYRRAHEMHFHGGDARLTLAAWDAYLAAEPAGRFSIDARYNRALILVRIGRYAEAHAALLPFARGEVSPAGYHQREAEQLVERLARFTR